MFEALSQCEEAVGLLDATDPSALSAGQMRAELLGLQHLIDRLTARQARVMQEADRSRFWVGTGAKDMADWMSRATKTSYAEAVGKVRLAEAMTMSPALADAVAAGDVSVAAATAVAPTIIHAAAGSDVEALVDKVCASTPQEAKRAAEAWKEANRELSPEDFEGVCRAKRRFSYGQPADGMISGTWSLPTLDARTVLNALAHLGGKPSEHDGRTGEQRLADGLLLLADAYAKGTVTGGHERPTILVSITAEAFAGLTDEPGLTANGDTVPADVVRHLSESAFIQRIVHSKNQVIELGAKERWVSVAQFEALFARDGGCRWPGCTIPARWCDADHLIPASEGGPTDLHNLVLWCRHHHREKHRSWVQVIGDAHDLALDVGGEVFACPPRGVATASRRPLGR